METTSATLLRSYMSPTSEGHECTIWQAARATSAAPTYFSPIQFGNPPAKYCDGGMRNNNPINQALWEAQAIWGTNADIHCILSIGTGAPGVKSVGIFGHQIARACIKIATDSEQTADDFYRHHSHQFPMGQLYFRFNVPHGLEDIQLDEWQHIHRIDACTKTYLADPLTSNILGKCAERLRLPSGETILSPAPPRWSPQPPSTPADAPPEPDTKSQPCPMPQYLYVSLRLSPYFTDRETTVEKIWAHFRRPDRGDDLEFAAVVGLGGTGKTQVALRYIALHKSVYLGVFFIESSTVAELNVAFYRIATLIIQIEMRQQPNLAFDDTAKKLGFSGLLSSNRLDTETVERSGQLVWAVNNWLRAMSDHRFLLVFDSLNDPVDTDIATYMPHGANADIVVTSRSTDILKLAGPALAIDLDALNEEAAIALLAKPAKLNLSPQQLVTARKLFKAVGTLPLVIDQIACYMASRQLGIDEVAKTYERHAEEWMKFPAMFGIGGNVWATCEATYEWALKNAPVSASLLFLLSFLCETDICGYLYNPSRQCRGVRDKDDIKYGKWAVTQIENGFSRVTRYWIVDRDPFILKDAFGKLLGISLIRQSTEPTSYLMHPVVHLWARKRLSQAEQALYARDAVLFVARALPSLEDSAIAQDWQIHRRLLPHMDACYRNAKAFLWEGDGTADDDAFFRGLEILAISYFCQGHYKEAEDIFSIIIVKAQGRSLPSTDVRVLHAKEYLAAVCDRLGDLHKGEALYMDVLAARKASLGLQHHLTLKTVSDLAGIYDYEGRVTEAKKFYDEALSGLEASVGSDDPQTASVRAELGSFYDHQGLLKEAEPLLHQALEDRESRLGKDAPDTLSSVMKLAGFYMHNRHLHQAAALYVALSLTQVSRLRTDCHVSPDTSELLRADLKFWDHAILKHCKRATVLPVCFLTRIGSWRPAKCTRWCLRTAPRSSDPIILIHSGRSVLSGGC